MLGSALEPSLLQNEIKRFGRFWVRIVLKNRMGRKIYVPSSPNEYQVDSNFQRRERDSNPRYSCPYNGFRDRHNRPLCHLSGSKIGVAQSTARSVRPRGSKCRDFEGNGQMGEAHKRGCKNTGLGWCRGNPIVLRPKPRRINGYRESADHR